MRWMIFGGVIAVLVGMVGLVAPVSVSPALPVVNCGSAAFPNLADARALDDGDASNVVVGEEVLVDTDYTRLCRMDLEDRRLWTVTLVGVGVLIAATGALGGALMRRSRRPGDDAMAKRRS